MDLKDISFRDKILHKATTLFSDYGFEEVTFREIAFELGVSEKDIKEQFHTKDELLDGVLEFFHGYIHHYDPTEEDIDEMLESKSVSEILHRFVTYYDYTNDSFRAVIYRFLFMEQYRSEKVGEFTYRYVMKPPMDNAKRVVDIFIEKELIPECDSKTITEMWNRTSLIFSLLRSLVDHDLDEYYRMTDFFIQLLERGVETLPTDSINLNIVPRFYWDDLDMDKLDIKHKIIFSALRLFSDYGYPNVSMSQIADKAGISMLVTYGIYRNKSHIMMDIYDLIVNVKAHYTDSNPAFASAMESGDHQRIVLTLSDSYSLAKDELSLKLYRIIFREVYNNEDIKDLLFGSLNTDVEHISKTLDAMAKSSRIKSCDSEQIAIAFVFCMCSYMISATLLSKIHPEEDSSKLKIINLLVSLVVNGYKN